ncbi:MAG TPA: DNA-binding response regulator [Desulfotomaculum sp.]|nr:DNA-binding response regulator [Desulfotomaculum sp.]
MSKILLVSNETNEVNKGETLRTHLEREGYKIILAGDGETVLKPTWQEEPDLIILDLPPEKDSLMVCRTLRQNSKTRHVPVIMLSILEEEMNRVMGLEAGADDYITKPFSYRELLARVKARLRRGRLEAAGRAFSRSEPERLTYGPLIIDRRSHMITVNGVKQEFTPKEFKILYTLVSRPGKVFSRRMLLEHIWGSNCEVNNRAVDMHVQHIRRKLSRQLPDSPQFIETVYGIGYRVKDNV